MPSGKRLTERANWTYNHAQQTRSRAYQVCKEICELSGLDPHTSILVGPTKKRDTMVHKVQTDYGGDFNQIKDPCRFMILFDDASQVIPVVRQDVIPGKNKNPMERYLDEQGLFSFRQQPKDMFETPKQWGYMAFYFNFNPSKPHRHVPFEIQMTQRDLQEKIYPQTHDIFESVRRDIEAYEREGIPFGRWNSEVRGAVMDMWNLHMSGANDYGVMDYVGAWPQLDFSTLAPDSADDIGPVDYESFDEMGHTPGYDGGSFEI